LSRFNLKQLCYDRLIRPILFTKDTPRSKAGGVGLGVFIAFTPTVGVQMPIAFGAATILGVNSPLAVAMAWLTNPVTVPPVYYFEYRIGAWMLGQDAIGSVDDFWKHWESVSAAHEGYWARVTHLAADVGYPLFLGSLPVALILALLAYPLTLWLCTRRARSEAAAVLTPVTGELLPEPAHEPLPGTESTVLSLDAATRERLARERTPPRDSSSAPGGGAGAILVFALATVTASQGCAKPRDPFTTAGAQVEARTEGEVPLLAGWCDDATVAVVAPLHAADGRDHFAQQKLLQLAGATPSPTCLALTLFRFGDGGYEWPDGPVVVEFSTGAGSVATLPPSQLLANATAVDAKLLEAMTGARGAPELGASKVVRLLVAVPGSFSLLDCSGGSLAGRKGGVALAPTRVGAVTWDELRSQPDRARFEQLFGAAGAGTTTASRAKEAGDDGAIERDGG
jgi:uncharacterized protein (DUF2062 family)